MERGAGRAEGGFGGEAVAFVWWPAPRVIRMSQVAPAVRVCVLVGGASVACLLRRSLMMRMTMT